MRHLKSIYQLFFFCFTISILGCSNDDDVPVDTFTDPRDGQEYELTRIGDQTWFAENLRYDNNDLTKSICYENDDINCFLYGRLYNGDVAQTACPDGWHLPTIEEWQELVDFLGGESAAVNLLEPLAKLQGEYVNFNILAGGKELSNTFSEKGVEGHYWTSTVPAGKPGSYQHVVYKPNTSISLNGGGSATFKESCRCIKD